MNKWECICLAIIVLSIGSCEAVTQYSRAQVEIANIECQEALTND